MITSTSAQRRATQNRAPQNKAADKAKIERYKKELEKKKEKYVSDFVNSLNVDDFQKEIISQKLHSYFEKKKTLLMTEMKSYKREELLENLDATHFLDIKDMVSEDTMIKIKDILKNKPKEKKEEKKKKKRKHKADKN
ncbi:hypothetical protein BXY80_1407 [Ichthyenterobacterium magnum]|uniref:Uncharacterized protein n=2 Tax=Ichthyenterobacterium magnum TaxID=1230530 RepID=A0A420DLZ0_9FLAO|nr:hypothetical protein BXY80_1407 [Ichthyenterobacterium magnum]